MPRYEDGTSFWQVSRSGTTVTVTTGKLGNQGRTSVKTHPTATAAQHHHDELVSAKLRAGYTLVAEVGAASAVIDLGPSAPDPDVAALEARLIEDPTDADGWLVYGDLLQKRGDPRGELIALQTAADAERAAKPRSGPRRGTQLAVTKHFAKHVAGLLGPLARHVKDVRELGAPPFLWKHGFIHRAELSSELARAAVLDELLRHPSGRLVRELALRVETAARATEALEALARHAPPVLQELDLFARAELGDLSATWAHAPRLRRLTLTARSFDVGDLRLPELQRAKFLALSLSPGCVAAIAEAPWPALERLDLRLGSRFGIVAATFEDLEPLLTRTDLPALTHLKIRNAPFAGAICRTLSASPLATQLQVLDLSHGTITPQDVKVLGGAKARFTQLRELWIPAAALWNDGATRLAGIATHVISDARSPLDTLEADVGVPEVVALTRYDEIAE